MSDKFNRWVTRRGVTGKAARMTGQKYLEIQATNPTLSPSQIFDLLVEFYGLHVNFRKVTVVADALVGRQTGLRKRSPYILVLETEIIEEELKKLGVPQEII